MVCDTGAFHTWVGSGFTSKPGTLPDNFQYSRRACGAHQREEKEMKKIILTVLSILCAFSIVVSAQNTNSSTTRKTVQNSNSKRKPIFRANKDQVKQAQAILKQRGFYAGEQSGKLDPDTRSGLKKYQEAEKITVTGTLNKVTLEKMGVALTDTQKTM